VAALALGPTTVGSAAIALDASPAGGVISGHVTIPDGFDVSNVDVSVSTEGNQDVAGATVSQSGDYTTGVLPAGSYIVMFRYLGMGPVLNQYAGHAYARDASPRVVVEDDVVSHVDAALELGAVLNVTLKDANAQPILGGGVSIAAIGAYDSINSLSMGRNGAFFWSSALPPGTYKISAGWQMLVTPSLNLTVGDGDDAPGSIAIAPGSTRSIGITVDLKGVIRGTATVRTGTGEQPYVGFVKVRNLHDPDSEEVQFAGENGSYDFRGLSPGEYQVEFEGGGLQSAVHTYYPGMQDSADAEPIRIDGSEEHDLHPVSLTQGGTLAGLVLLESAAGTVPATEAAISLAKLEDVTGNYLPAGVGHVDDSGNFSMTGLMPGTYSVFVRSTDPATGPEWYQGARYFADRTDVSIQAGLTTSLQNMVLKPRTFDRDRLGGTDRFDTAVKITQAMYPDPSRDKPSIVYLVNAYNYPDALAAGPAAIAQGGAVLPVNTTATPDAITTEVERLDPDRIVVVGGAGAVSAAVYGEVDKVTGATPIARIGGADRYDTGNALVRDAFAGAGSPRAIIATGGNYPDALAAGAAAGHLGAPVILVEGGAAGLSASTRSLLADLKVTEVLIAGGSAAVSSAVEKDLDTILGSAHVRRVAGQDRYQTAAQLNAVVFPTSEAALVASGSRFPDALAGAPLAGLRGAPLYLSPGSCVDHDTMTQLLNQDVVGITLLGGSAVLDDGVEGLSTC
jgi:putative cell wall-binding protein